MELKQAIAECRQTGLSGWEMVEYVNALVHRVMPYSTGLPLAGHRRAFRAGKGYCVQQAFCVREILTALGIRTQAVYCVKAAFDNGTRVSGHTWCRVTIGTETRDVCSCHDGNRPGTVAFTPLTPVKPYRGLVVLGGYLGSIPVCIKRWLARG